MLIAHSGVRMLNLYFGRNMYFKPIKILKFLCCFFAIISLGCKEVYQPPFIIPRLGYLVVEGFINSQGVTNIKLTRSLQLGSGKLSGELGALVRVEGENNTQFPLSEKGQGLYSADQLPLQSNVKYRLYVKTFNAKEYISDYSQVRNTPAIDSIEWERADGVQIYINSHDPQNTANYYRWEFDETWKFQSAHRSILKYVRNGVGTITGVAYRTTEESDKLYTCWRTEGADKILTGTTVQLSSDSIGHIPITYIPRKSVKISILYSINVRQFAINEAEYNFYQTMKKTTEQLGTIFDPQPTQIAGNIHCKTDPSEIVIGYISVSQAQEKRIFISNAEVPGWGYLPDCPETPVANKPDQLILAGAQSLVPTIPRIFTPSGLLDTINVAGSACVDCTTLGTNIKPSFWP